MRFQVYIRYDGGEWEDISAYVQPVWDASYGGEPALNSYYAGSVQFSLIDKDTGNETHGLIAKIIQDAEIAEVKVYADSVEIFYGIVERSQFVWASDVITGFTACTLMQYADKIDVSPARNGEGEITTYSGLAAPLLTSALRKLGCQAGTVKDVLIRDYALGTEQSDCDWIVVKRVWSDDLDGFGVTDVVAGSPNEGGNMPLYFLKDGILYRSTIYGQYQEARLWDGSRVTSSGYRLFHFLGPGSIPCLLIVEAEKISSWSSRVQFSDTARWASLIVSMGSMAASMFVPGLGQLARAAVLVGGQAAGWGISELGKKVLYERGLDTITIAKSFRVVSLPDTMYDLGERFDQSFSNLSSAAGIDFFTPIDLICVGSSNGVGIAPGEVYWVQRTISGNYYLRGVYWNTMNASWSRASGWGFQLPTDLGIPTGGMAMAHRNRIGTNPQRRIIAIGTTYGVLILKGRSDGRWWVRAMKTTTPPGRWMSALTTVSKVYFILGGGAKVPNGYNLEGKPAVIAQSGSDANTAPEYAEITGYPGDEIMAAAPNILLSGDGQMATIIFHTRENGRTVLRAGGVVTCSSVDEIDFLAGANDLCPRSMPEIVDWCPPAVVLDTAQGIYRMFTGGSAFDRDRIISDFACTSLYARAYIHWDFARDRMTIGQLLREAAASFWLKLNVNTPYPCNSADDRRIISRHAWTPPGTSLVLGKPTVCNPGVEGVEYYDGAIADICGQRIEAGNTAIGKMVATVSGAFLQPCWAKVITGEIVLRYPAKSNEYPYGRRIFTAESVYPVPISALGKKASVTFLSGVNANAIITSAGCQRASATFPMRMLEVSIDPTSGKAYGNIWENDEPEPVYLLCSWVDGDSISPSSPPEDVNPREFHMWNCPCNVEANYTLDSPVTTPPSPYVASAYAFPIYLPASTVLAEYAYVLCSPPDPTWGGMKISLWTNEDNAPGTEIIYDGEHTTRAEVGDGYAGAEVGLNYVAVARRTPLAPGVYWIVCVMHLEQEGSTPAPNIMIGYASAAMQTMLRFRGWCEKLTVYDWLEEWNGTNVIPAIPYIIAVGEGVQE